jgi:hypothetical protein
MVILVSNYLSFHFTAVVGVITNNYRQQTPNKLTSNS